MQDVHLMDGIKNLRPLTGVVSVSFRSQGWRSFLAQPLANGWHSFGMCLGV